MNRLKVFLLLGCLLPSISQALTRDRELRRGRFAQRGNERSERVHRLNTGSAHYAGNGCPNGTMRVVFAPDYLSFTVIFDQFIAEAQGGRGQKRDLMNCTAVVPIEIPPNMQMEITRVDFRGFVSLPKQATAALVSSFNFTGPRGDRERMNMRYRFSGPVQDNYEISSDVLVANGRIPETEASPCGGTARLRIVNQLKVNTRSARDAATVTLDSIDGAAHAVYQVNWRTCRPR